MAALGLGLGPAGPMVTIAVQNAVEPRDMGVATSLTSFFRSMGGSFGVALLGAILFAGLTRSGIGNEVSASGLLHGGPAMIAALPDALRHLVVASFTQSFRHVYIAGAAICGCGLALSFFMKELPLRSRLPPPPPPASSREPALAEPAADTYDVKR
jgi:hypothetical protein